MFCWLTRYGWMESVDLVNNYFKSHCAFSHSHPKRWVIRAFHQEITNVGKSLGRSGWEILEFVLCDGAFRCIHSTLNSFRDETISVSRYLFIVFWLFHFNYIHKSGSRVNIITTTTIAKLYNKGCSPLHWRYIPENSFDQFRRWVIS